jgi:hypothetical protein
MSIVSASQDRLVLSARREAGSSVEEDIRKKDRKKGFPDSSTGPSNSDTREKLAYRSP